MKIAMVVLPDGDIQKPRVIFHDLTDVEKEIAFDVIDAELHDETYKDLDKMVSTLRNQVEDLGETIDQYEELIEDLEHRKVV